MFWKVVIGIYLLAVVVVVMSLIFGKGSSPGTNSDDGYQHGRTYE